MLDLNEFWIDIECPKCKYHDYVQLIDIKTEKKIFCHNCKIEIQITDSESSTHKTIESINTSFKNLEEVFKNFNK